MNKAQEYAKRKFIQNVIKGTLLGLTLIVSLWITLNEQYHWVPDLEWRSVKKFFGVSEPLDSELPCIVYSFDVGAGDCFYIQCADHHILVDTGTFDSSKQVSTALERMGVDQLDYLFLSHYHDDHTGGFEMMVHRFKPEHIVLGARTEEKRTEVYHDVLSIAQDSDSKVLFASAGDLYQIGKLGVSVISVDSDLSTENDRSLVLRFQYGDIRMLFVGDAQERLEKKMLEENPEELAADWIKIAHHGSRTSTSEAFLKAVSPRYAVVTCGDGGEPSQEVLMRLRQYTEAYYRTDLSGEVLFATDGVKCEIFAEKS